MPRQSKKSAGSSRKRAVPAVVDDADVRQFVDHLMKLLTKLGVADSLDAEMAYDLALFSQKRADMTTGYAEAFAQKVRQKVEWATSTKPTD